jgi:glycosyltransferase involved in cell wall biosynthesis
LTPPDAGAGAAEPTVSCIIPTLESEFLGASIESVLSQTHRPLELIVVDDCPGDEVAALVRGFGEPVRLLRGTDTGPAAARNAGVAAARGELIAFNDADDLWHPEKLARQVARFHARPELDASVTHVAIFWEEEVAWEEEALRDNPRAQVIPGWATITLLARTQAFEQVGPLEEGRTFTDAVDWFARARDAGLEIELLDDVLVHHRRRSGSLTRRREEGEREFLGFLRDSIRRRKAEGETSP